MRIHIIGFSGSGKGTDARHVSGLLQIPHYDPDDRFCNNAQKGQNARG